MPMIIDSFQGPWRFLSNFFVSTVILGGVDYPTVEHAFQAAKTMSVEETLSIRKAFYPRDAKRLGRSLTLRSDWEEIKEVVMLHLLRQKFSDPLLKMQLL